MVNRLSNLLAACAFAGITLLAGCGSGGTSTNAAPRIGTIPAQSLAGGAALSLDLAPYVTDREGATLGYAVDSGGGSFAGSTYSNMFATMGNYTVVFHVDDGAGKQTVGRFDVQVTSAKLVVVSEGASGLLLVDADTDQILRVSGAAPSPQLATGLADGRLVYQMSSPLQLWVFDPMTRTATRLAPHATGDVTYVTKTSDDRVVYTEAGATRRLHVYNPRSQLTRDIAEDVPASGSALANGNGILYFTLLDGGQGDVYVFDVSADTVTAVSTAATDERLRTVLPDGGAVFSRVGAGGEHDLFYFRAGTGLVEIAAGTAALDPMDKAVVGHGSASQVVFSATDGTHDELYSWSPANGQVTTIHSGGVAAFAAIGAGNEVVYTIDNGGGDVDAAFFDLDDGTAATVRNAADTTTVFGIADGGAIRYAIVQGSGATSSVLAVSLVAAPATVTFAGGGAMEFELVLQNGDAVARRSDGTAIAVFTASAGTWSSFAGTGLDVVGPGVDAGDFVYSQTVSAQIDLAMWDASAAASVPVSAATGDDLFQLATNGKVYYTRADTSGHANLFAVQMAGPTTTQLTQTDGTGLGFDHTVLGTYAGSR